MTRLEDLQERWEHGYDKQDDINPVDYAWLLGHAAGLQAHVHELLKEEKPREGGLWGQQADPNNPVFDFLKELTSEKIAAVWDSIDKEELARIIMERTKPYRTSRLSHAEMIEPLGDAPPMSVREESLSQKDIAAIVNQGCLIAAATIEFLRPSIDSNPECQCGCSYKSHQGDRGDCTNCLLCPKFRVSP